MTIVGPGGAPRTNFIARTSGEGAGVETIPDHLPFLDRIGPVYGGRAEAADAVEKVVAAIRRAATDGTDRLRYAPTDDIAPLLSARRGSPEDEHRASTRAPFVSGRV